ncbi:MAG: thiamine ABC transporter substrate binding subunit [Arenicellales bacterium]
MRFSLITLLLISNLALAQDKPVLTVYTYDSFASEWGPGPKVEAAFEEECECDLNFVAVDSSTGILSRVQLEGEGSSADVVLGLDNSLVVEAQNTGLIAEHEVDMTKLDLPLPWNNQKFLPFDFGFFAFIYDTSRMTSPPNSFEKLLDAGDNLKIVIQDPRSSTTGLGFLLWVKSLYGEDAPQAWNRLAPKVLTVTKGWSEAYGMFLEGEADMVLSYTTSPAYHMIVEQESRYKAIGFPEGHGIQIEVAAVLKNAPHPELAQRFMRFIASEPFQTLIPTGNWMYPVIFPKQGLPAEFRDLVRPIKTLMIDPQGIADNKADWIDEFNQALSQ